jgi:hypothetical protein
MVGVTATDHGGVKLTQPSVDKQYSQDFMPWFFKRIRNCICPHCDKPIKRTVVKGCHAYTDPCKCLLYRLTIEHTKVASLDEYRSAKTSFMKIKNEHPNSRYPFGAYCLYWSRYKAFFKAKLRQRLRQKRGNETFR